MLYELLTGRVPFDGDSAVTIALKQVSEPPVPPSALNPASSPELEAVVLRALAKDPAQRYADADEFIAALDARARRRGRSTAAAAVAALAAAARPRRRRRTPPRRRRRTAVAERCPRTRARAGRAEPLVVVAARGAARRRR